MKARVVDYSEEVFLYVRAAELGYSYSESISEFIENDRFFLDVQLKLDDGGFRIAISQRKD